MCLCIPFFYLKCNTDKEVFMRLLDIVERLEREGYIIKYRHRPDGGILITSVNGEKFKGAKGNTFVREIAGVKLSEARRKQLESIKPEKNLTPKQRKKDPIDESTLKLIRRVNRKLKKMGNSAGHVTITQYRKNIKRFGKEEAHRLLKQAEKYSKGDAYVENIRWYKERLVSINNWFGGNADLEEIVDIIDRIIALDGAGVKDSELNTWYDILYDLEQTAKLGDKEAPKRYNKRMKAVLPKV